MVYLSKIVIFHRCLKLPELFTLSSIGYSTLTRGYLGLFQILLVVLLLLLLNPYIYTYTYIYVNIYIYVYVCIYVYVYAYIYIFWVTFTEGIFNGCSPLDPVDAAGS